ncbi:uncharacterized protein E0L32_004971 [Thyridium curvatum]|uniref:Kinetochore protein Sos7 coiled-coil domain-containing protein n=1 Tax=Thyridium curvatum TaxID=1093900 RepID=A0A507AY20_9PEZI|nr:uncharacterized protein E0L32_004971 [Thyridium curvatum]TPX14862.1 hypothetical protein E0L32_004971 [Thyridium curvatum]
MDVRAVFWWDTSDKTVDASLVSAQVNIHGWAPVDPSPSREHHKTDSIQRPTPAAPVRLIITTNTGHASRLSTTVHNMDRRRVEEVLRKLDDLQEGGGQEISILKISEPISSAMGQDAANNTAAAPRTSDASSSSMDAGPTPASLEADLAHYRELFAKLRFSYVEQVTKEKFIRAIVGDPPLIVTPQDTVALETQNRTAKSQLKALKAEVADAVAELERKGRELSRRYEGVRAEAAALRALPDKIAGLEERIAALRRAGDPGAGDNPLLALPLSRTLQLVDERRAERHELDRQLQQLRSQAPRRHKEAERLQAELGALEARRQNTAAAAGEARRRKEAALGGVQDDLEERGRWYRGGEAALKQMLDLEG